MRWSISVKTVGGYRAHEHSTVIDGKETKDVPSPTKTPFPSNFTVEVDPDQTLSSLNKQIEEFTGLDASQQRLIYRGRIISGGGKSSAGRSENSESATKENVKNDQDITLIRDVEGLCDGQTIHLVPRPLAEIPNEAPTAAASLPNSTASTGTGGGNNGSAGNDNLSGSSTASLLATLLGLGVSGAFTSASDEDGEGDETDWRNRQQSVLLPNLSLNRQRQLTQQRRQARIDAARGIQRRAPAEGGPSGRWPSTWAAGARNGSDPGSLEPVRQGLMTIHTMLDHLKKKDDHDSVASSQAEFKTMDGNRSWYRGQWLDCRDTVNQWLEATVVDVVRPEDILSLTEMSSCGINDESISVARSQKRKRENEPSTDPIVGANDLDGRKRLLQELSDEYSNEEEKEFKLRDNNKQVQLLLIHYNGWPHRWDEWIRSDSERIRPFRTKTRHSPSAPYASPTPQSVFQAAPTTFITNSDGADREALLPELHGIISSVDTILSKLTSNNDSQKQPSVNSIGSLNTAPQYLPWRNNTPRNTNDEEHDRNQMDNTSPRRNWAQCDVIHLTALAPLLDRLGRTLTDAAPHVAALASSITIDEKPSSNNDESECKEPNVQDIMGESIVETTTSDIEQNGQTGTSATDPLLANNTVSAVSNGDNDLGDTQDNSEYADYIYGMVNISRNEVSSQRNNRIRQQENSGGPNTSSLLATYLTAAGLSGNSSNGGNNDDNGNVSVPTLARLLRASTNGNGDGGGSGGIDIHIHAIVTPAPGLAMMGGGMGGFGLMTLPTPATEQARTSTDLGETDSSNRSNNLTTDTPATTNFDDDDELGLFSELYSETPEPVSAVLVEPTSPVQNISNQNDTPESEELRASEIEAESIPIDLNPPTAVEIATTPIASPVEIEENNIIQNDISNLSLTIPHRDIPFEQRSNSSVSSGGRESRRGSTLGRLIRRALGRRSSPSGENESLTSPERH